MRRPSKKQPKKRPHSVFAGILFASLIALAGIGDTSVQSACAAEPAPTMSADPAESANEPAPWSVAVSLPQLLEFAYQQNLTASWSLRMGLGGTPLERAWPASLSSSNNVSDTYSFTTAPRAYFIVSTVKGLYHAPGSRWTFSAGAELWMIHAGALIFLKNRDTSESVNVADLDARWWQPWVALGASYKITRESSSGWSIDAGLARRVFGGLRTRLQGPLPALQEVAPEYAAAITDGSSAAENSLTGSLRKALNFLPLMPSLGARYTW